VSLSVLAAYENPVQRSSVGHGHPHDEVITLTVREIGSLKSLSLSVAVAAVKGGSSRPRPNPVHRLGLDGKKHWDGVSDAEANQQESAGVMGRAPKNQARR
jgi:hypothetical protein